MRKKACGRVLSRGSAVVIRDITMRVPSGRVEQMLATEALRVLNVVVTADQSAKSPDWWARGIALGAALISLINLAFTIGKEWWRGRRVRVTTDRRTIEGSSVYAVKVTNTGGLSVYVTDWGYVCKAGRGPWRDRRWYEPNSTGIRGPALPSSLSAGEEILFNTDASRVEAKATDGNPKRYMRGYVVISSSTRRRYSKPIRLL